MTRIAVRLRSILAQEGFSSEPELGRLRASIDGDSRYGEEITVWQLGRTIELRQRSWFPKGGADSGSGIGSTESVLLRVPAGSASAKELYRAILEHVRGNPTLSRYAKINQFQWFPMYGPRFKGLTLKTVGMALDTTVLNRAEWEVKWLEPEVEKAPVFDLTGKRDMAGIMPVLISAGYQFIPAERGRAAILTNGRQAKALIKDLTSASSAQFGTQFTISPSLQLRFSKELSGKWVLRIIE